MGSSSAAPASPSWRSLALAMIGWLGLAACLTMVYLAMRAVMDVGGYCAEGGPYVISQTCPEGSTPALFLGIFGGMAFAFMASVGGLGVGGIWAATPLLAWSALFGSLGWNFLDYGIFSAGEQGIEWGWAICGVVFWAMAFVPLLGLIPMLRGEVFGPPSRRGSGGSRPAPAAGSPSLTALDGPAQSARRPVVVSMTGTPTVSPDGRTVSYSSAVIEGDVPDESREELAQIAADFGAAIGAAMADVPLDPELRRAPGLDGAAAGAAPPPGDRLPGAGEPEPEFTEGTQALLDRLERLADMRDRGLLAPEEYATAKATIIAELEGRS